MSNYSKTDSLYIEFIESLDMFVPDNDCADYRDQDDYRAMGFVLSKIKALEAKNAELENQLKLSNEFVDIWRDKAIELEKKLESVEMVHSNYVNVSCDLYSTLEKKLEIALSALSNWLSWEDEQIEQAGPYHGQRITQLINEGKVALAAISGEGV